MKQIKQVFLEGGSPTLRLDADDWGYSRRRGDNCNFVQKDKKLTRQDQTVAKIIERSAKFFLICKKDTFMCPMFAYTSVYLKLTNRWSIHDWSFDVVLLHIQSMSYYYSHISATWFEGINMVIKRILKSQKNIHGIIT